MSFFGSIAQQIADSATSNPQIAAALNPPYNPAATTGGSPPSTGPPPPAAQTPAMPANIKPFMTPGQTFQPHTQFGQTASAPLNLSQQGRTYGAPDLYYPNTVGVDIARNALQTHGIDPAGMNANQLANMLHSINPRESYRIVGFADGGMTNPTPQFQNPFGPQQTPNGPRMNNPGPMQQPAFDPRTQPQSVSVGGTPQQPGLPSLLSNNTQNQYPNGYTPIGQPQQNTPNYGMYRS
jgi:hypothetical protein